MGFKRAMPHGHNYDVEKYKYDYLPLQAYGGTYAIALTTEAAAGEPAINTMIISAGAGNPSFDEITDSGIVGLAIDDTADGIGILYPVPYDMDVKSKMEFAVVHCCDQTTTTDTMTWAVVYTELTINSEAIEVGATALNTAIAADTNVSTARAIQQTPWGILNGGTLTHGNWLSLHVSYASESGVAADAGELSHGMYLVIRYVRRAI